MMLWEAAGEQHVAMVTSDVYERVGLSVNVTSDTHTHTLSDANKALVCLSEDQLVTFT